MVPPDDYPRNQVQLGVINPNQGTLAISLDYRACIYVPRIGHDDDTTPYKPSFLLQLAVHGVVPGGAITLGDTKTILFHAGVGATICGPEDWVLGVAEYYGQLLHRDDLTLDGAHAAMEADAWAAT